MTGGGAFEDMVALLWPGSASVGGRRRPGRAPRPPARDYVLVPAANRPRLLVPRRPLRATATALGRYKGSATGAGLLRLRAAALAARLGAADLLPDRVRVDPPSGGAPAPGIEDHLGEVLGREVLLAMHIGPRRAVQKPVLQLISPQGQLLGFAKLGVNPLTRELVRAEARHLEVLAGLPLRAVTVPRLLHHGTWGPHELLVQEPLTRTGTGEVTEERRVAAALEVARARGVTTHALRDSPYLRRLADRVEALADTPQSALLRSATARLRATAGDRVAPFGSWHGDWAPWNMTGSPGTVMVWDWEFFGADVPLGFDDLHFRVQEEVVGLRRDPVDALARLRRGAGAWLPAFGVPAESTDLVAALYVLEIATRYLEDGEMDGDTAMGRLDWLEPALAAFVERSLPTAPR